MCLLSQDVCGSEVQAQLSWIFCIESYRAVVKMSARLWSHLEV